MAAPLVNAEGASAAGIWQHSGYTSVGSAREALSEVRMRVNNQLAPERRDWSFIAFKGLPAGAGVLFEEVTLDEGIGPEAVALLIEPELDELLGKTSLDL